MIVGFCAAFAAGLLWGFIFIGPVLLPEYPSVLQSTGRYIAFGCVSILLGWYDRNNLRKLLFKDWLEAIRLVFIGNLLYYTCLASAIQNAGSGIVTVILGTLPLVMAIMYNFICKNKEEKLPWRNFFLSLILVLSGLIFTNIAELVIISNLINIKSYIVGVILSIFSVICWSWYALRNARWLHNHPYNKSATWATAQGVIMLPLSIILYLIICYFFKILQVDFQLPFGPRPKNFIFLMLIIGLFCSWLGTFFWNEASQRLPTIFIGPLIMFETLSGLLYTFIYRQIWPSLLTIFGIILLIIGIVCIVNFRIIIKK